MTRFIAVVVLLAALLGLATFELLYINKNFDKMTDETNALIETVSAVPDDTPFDPYLRARVDELYDFWIGVEHKMCIFVKHIDLSYISDALIYAQNFIHNDNKEESLAGLKRLSYLLDAYSHIYGLDISNVL